MSTARPTIAILNALYAPYAIGGAETSVRLLAENLSDLGLRAIVISLGDKPRMVRDSVAGLTVYRLPLGNIFWPYDGRRRPFPARAAWQLLDIFNPIMAQRVGTILDEETPSLLHSHNLPGFSVSVWRAARRRNLPVVHTLRDYSLLCSRGGMFRNGKPCHEVCALCTRWSMARRHASRHVDHVVGVSRFTLDMHLRNGFFAGSRSSVINNPWEPAAPRPATDAPAGNGPRIGYFGRLEPPKGVEVLLAAFAGEKRPSSRLLMCGRGDEGYVQWLKATFPDPRIEWKGFVAPADVFPELDAVVIPSVWHEPYSRVALEAASAGLPIVCSDRGGMSEIYAVVPGARHYPAEDVGALADILRAMEPLSGAPRPWRPSNSSPRSVAERYAGIYEALL